MHENGPCWPCRLLLAAIIRLFKSSLHLIRHFKTKETL